MYQPKLTTDIDELVDSFSKLKAMQMASNHHIRNIDNWFKSYGDDAIDPEEKHYKGDRGDLVTMHLSPQYRLIALLLSSRAICRLFELTARKRCDRGDSDSTSATVDISWLEVMATMLVLAVGLSMAFASIWWLNFVEDKVYRLAIITASGTIMSLIAWVAAGNRPFEILATFAAYMAVLMIYQQISS